MENEKRDRRLFLAILLLGALAILIFNIFTPMMTDDYTYAAQAMKASSVKDLVGQVRYEYMTWNGRVIGLFLLRWFLLRPAFLFKLANSAVFMLLVLLIYRNLDTRKRYDPLILLLVQLFLWFFAVDFSESVLWMTGAVIHLWGTTIILAFMTCMRRAAGLAARQGADTFGTGSPLQAPPRKLPAQVPAAILFFVFGAAAGWCNENTSGGALLFVLYLIARRRIANKKAGLRTAFSLPLAAGLAGLCIGLYKLVTAPGSRMRAGAMEENHTGLYGLFSRFQKITLTLRDCFLILLVLLIAVTVLTYLQMRRDMLVKNAAAGIGDGAGDAAVNAAGSGAAAGRFRGRLFLVLEPRIVFFLLFGATSYALVLTAQTQPRAFLGAGIFLTIAVLQGVLDVLKHEELQERELLRASAAAGAAAASTAGSVHAAPIAVRFAVRTAAAAMLLVFFFTYMDCGAMLVRIDRDDRQRIAWIIEQREKGADEVVVPMLHPEFNNRYTVAYESDLTEDPEYWTNVAYESFYGVERIIAIPYDEWKAKYAE